jgi:Zn-dependent protease with chaperone function
MAAIASFYPPSPTNVPAGLTEVTPGYRLSVLALLASVALFFALYFFLLLISVLLMLLPLLLWPRRGLIGLYVLECFLSIFGFLMFACLVKGFFKHRKDSRRSTDIEVTAEEQPRLFAFIADLCAETGTDLPGRVYVSYEVNASAGYDPNLVSLLLPSRKNLKIGLGLVNCLNLTEFKAVLAHEFGHFSQDSMKLGGYVYLAHMLILDMLCGRDFLDELIDDWRYCDEPILQWPAVLLYSFTWTTGQIFYWMFWGILLLHKTLERQMEFHADLVAASVTGSDAITHALKRVTFGDRLMEYTLEQLALAAEHKLHSRDLFLHQERFIGPLRKLAKDPDLGEPPPLPDDETLMTRVFDPEEEAALPLMWADHPPNYQREENVKRLYVCTTFDTRSPWILFDNTAELRRQATYKMYRVILRIKKKDVVLDPAEDVQEWFDEERRECTYDSRYQGLYDDRLILPGNIRELAQAAVKTPWPTDKTIDIHATLYDAAVRKRTRRYSKHREDLEHLQRVRDGRVKLDHGYFNFVGESYHERDLERLMRVVEDKLKEDDEWLSAQDQKVFIVHYQMALHLGESTALDLMRRYAFHTAVQELFKNLREHVQRLEETLDELSEYGEGPMDTKSFSRYLKILQEAHHAMKDCLKAAEELPVPALKNVEAGQPLRGLLLKKEPLSGVSSYDQWINTKWIHKLIEQIDHILGRTARIHFKSLGGILALQEQISKECLARWAVVETVAEEPA